MGITCGCLPVLVAFCFWEEALGDVPWLADPRKHSWSQVLELQPEMWLRQDRAVLILLNPSPWLPLVQES